MRTLSPIAALWMITSLISMAHAAKPQAFADPKKTDKDFAFQGEYSGMLTVDGQSEKWAAQVIALGGGKFRTVGYKGGLPGDGWDMSEGKQIDGEGTSDQVTFTGENFKLVIHNGQLAVHDENGQLLGKLEKVERKSPTLGAKPPAGAVVLFDGSTAEQFAGGRLSEDRLLMPGVTSKRTFRDFTCHLEFRLPYMPEARGQQRGNSGCYVQGRYEVQMLDSFGLEGLDNECGGIYQVARPRINMCYPPLTWQTYDIDFTAARFENGKQVKPAHMTVRHNGVVIHENLELKQPTPGNSLADNDEPGPIYLQEHGNPVRFRNIWVLEK